ncbi:vWA domain-containing protein [Planococcus maitriensis]|uniref:VWA domain-containing protein n=1 Tax=Planococcus maitriensis TaxID=221799 RepID=A0A365KDH5_9BACL|nr:VWA domain-containing protein [Planococcus maitriensis]RAZ70261.1 VWA domain-containing protein [Planococcus maitriensis]
MTSINRFIQFNNETVDTRLLNRMEHLARALSSAPYLKVTTRKLWEFRPSEGAVSMSVFWRHRPKEIEQAGYLSDIYLVSAGFWRHFSMRSWRDFERMETGLPELSAQLLLMAEEFRLSDRVVAERPGTKPVFEVREKIVTGFHEDQLEQNRKKGFWADAFLNAAYLKLRGKDVSLSDELDPLFLAWTELFSADSTDDSMRTVQKILPRLEYLLGSDALHTYYTFGEPAEKMPPPRYHEGIEAEQPEGEEEIDTIEEWFQSWHRETELNDAAALEYELERGDSKLADGGREEEGAGEVEQTGTGESQGEHREDNLADERRKDEKKPKKANGRFGSANDGVVYYESRIEPLPFDRQQLQQWRSEQAPYVRALLKEMQKRMQQRVESERTNLHAGRLSKNLLPLVTDERPKPFYRKTAPSKQLDAVFSLMIDGSASMVDKLDETKQAVLLFHDVLRSLNIPHEIAVFYEDAYEAGDDKQPNYFEWLHKFTDGMADHAAEIMSLDAHEDNRDGFAIRWMAERLKLRPEKHRFMLVFSDGEPSAYNYADNGIIDTAQAVSETGKMGIEVMHLFLSGESTSEEQAAFYRMLYGNKSVSADSLEQFVEQTLRLLKRTLHLVVQAL